MLGRLMLCGYLGYQLNSWKGWVYCSPSPLSPATTGPLLVNMPEASSASSYVAYWADLVKFASLEITGAVIGFSSACRRGTVGIVAGPCFVENCKFRRLCQIVVHKQQKPSGLTPRFSCGRPGTCWRKLPTINDMAHTQSRKGVECLPLLIL